MKTKAVASMKVRDVSLLRIQISVFKVTEVNSKCFRDGQKFTLKNSVCFCLG